MMEESMNQESAEKAELKHGVVTGEEKPRLPASAHVMCGWPLLLAAVGGALGGGLGGAAYGINVAIYKSKLPVPVKAILNVLVGLSAVGIWFGIVVAIRSGRK